MLTISLTIPEKVISTIDKKRGDVSRSRFVTKLLEKGLQEENH
jgi:metal-responsive CopG/Arc/MetJ family transcriptional regulator